jgi:glycosyltransferase involved in cell wall biosynthesis
VRVVVVHNRYRSENPSGENHVVESDIEQLRADGVKVYPYIRDSDEIANWTALGKASLAVRPLVSPADSIAFRRMLRDVRPHIVHLHNTFPLISPWIVRTAKAQGVPVVQTVHNYRHVCVNGIFFRDGQMCTECVGKSFPWPAVKNGCYQGSRARSFPMAAAVAAHRGTWQLVDRFFPVGEAGAEHLRSLGIPDGRIEVRVNVVDDPGVPTPLGHGALFVGRLSAEKGIEMLLDAWRRSGLGTQHTLSIAGDGVIRPRVEEDAAADQSIQYLGLLNKEELDDAYRRAALVVVPSLCPDQDPVALATALSHGRPIVGSALGSIPSSLSNGPGWVTEPSTAGLADALAHALGDRAELQRRGIAARARYKNNRDPLVAASLVDSYRRVTASAGGSEH